MLSSLYNENLYYRVRAIKLYNKSLSIRKSSLKIPLERNIANYNTANKFPDIL